MHMTASMTTIPDFTIVGGGINGLLTAREFINAGARTAIIDKQVIGQESSWAGGGILLPLYPWRQAEAISALVLESLRSYPHLLAALYAQTGLDPQWQPCGLLVTKNPDAARARAWCKQHQVACFPAEPKQFNNLQTEPETPLWLPDIAHVRNPRLLKSLKQDLSQKGCQFYQHQPITKISLKGNRVVSLASHEQVFPVHHVVLAGGAWTGQIFQELLPTLGHIPKITPVKGQMLLYEAQPETLAFMVLEGGHYLIPRRDGKILAGSSVEFDGFNKATSSTVLDTLNAFALNLLPTLKGYPIARQWAGLRPGTAEGIPYIGPHPEIANLSVNAGHFRNGLVMAPASARLLVDLVLGRPPCLAEEPYQFTRPH